MRSETGFDPELYTRFPTKGDRPPGELAELERVWCAPRGWQWISAINNNYVGVYYIGAAMLFFVLAGALSVLMRTQLALPMQGFLAQETYNQVFTVHGTMMMFLFAVPAVEALAVLLLPQMLGARDLPFPRLSAYAFWAYLLGGLAFFASLFFGLAPNGGWFMYPPLTSTTYSPGINADMWLLGIGFIEISAIAGAIEIIVGVLRNRAPGMTLSRMPIFAWAMLIFGVMIIIAFPSVILATTLMELERALDWPFFDPARGGDPLLWQHLFWFFGHPEVYIIFLPAAGAMSTIIPAIARTTLVGYRLVVLAMLATGFISFGVWAHHMFATGMPTISTSYFSAASMAVSVPAGIQVFAWIATLAAGKVTRWSTPALFAVGGLVIFVMGGLTGVMVAMVPFDWQAHDSYFIVAHLHYVLIGGMVFPFFAALYYWMPMSSSRPLSERMGRWVFWLMFVGMHVTFLPMHLTGLMGMPRRVYTYLPDRGWEWPNLISTLGAFLFALAVLLWIIDMIRNFRPFGEDAGDVWKGPGLEWLPTGLYSIRSIPVVRSMNPMWDQPELKDQVEQGRWFLPGSATGRRETLVTSTVNAEPQYLQRMPVPSPWPIWAAVFTAGAFLILTIQAYWPALISGVLAIYCLIGWAWTLDLPADQPMADIGAGIRVPTYVAGPKSHGWWAMVITLLVAGMIWALTAFSYVFLWSRNPQDWPPPPDLVTFAPVAGAYLAAIGLCWLAARLIRRESAWGPTAAATAMLGAAGLAVLAGWGDFESWRATGLDPTLTAHGAMIHAFLGWQGFFLLIVAIMGLYVPARRMAGLLARERPSTVDLCGLFIAYTAAQGLGSAVLVRFFPGA